MAKPAQGPNILVIDCETTGIEADIHKVVEVAAVLVDPSRRAILDACTDFVDPGIPIPPESKGIHHIGDEDVAGKPALADVIKSWDKRFGRNWVPAAHYAAFDSTHIVLPSEEWICTHRCAKHLWSDAPSHSNQSLRYWLPELDFYANMEGRAMPPHRALPDAWVTAHILLVMLRDHNIGDLLQLTKAPILLKKCGFGKHRGEDWERVPRDYLNWILRQRDFDPDVVHTARHWLNGGT